VLGPAGSCSLADSLLLRNAWPCVYEFSGGAVVKLSEELIYVFAIDFV